LVRRTEEERRNLDGLFNPVKPADENPLLETTRDGISFGKEEERVSIVSYSDVQSLNDLQCYVTLPGSYPVVKLTMKYEA
ncbi:hypothetical protein COJ96_25980, partial [Bacillus sp. AFS073361]|uniref:type IV secretion system DNA-binding domain-containing protein n=1 Tax=Bacillus sp. AFS073361 TaxID=2033511 RepID=UPI000C00D106